MITAEDFQQFSRNEGKQYLIELYDDMWMPARGDTPQGAMVGPAMRLSMVAIQEVAERLKTELERDPTDEEVQRRLGELAQSGTNVQEPVRGSILSGTITVQKGLVHVKYETQGGAVTTAFRPEAIKCVSYVDEGLIQSGVEGP